MVLTYRVWTPTPDRCQKHLSAWRRRKGRARWLLGDQTAIDEREAPLPALHSRDVYLTVEGAAGRRSFPGRPSEATCQGRGDHGARIQEAWNHPLVERRDHLAAMPALPAPLLEETFALEFTQAPNPQVVPGPLLAAAPRTAKRKRRWYARGGFLPGLRSEPPSQLRRLFPWPESSLASAHDGSWLSRAFVSRLVPEAQSTRRCSMVRRLPSALSTRP